jgi:hypothetical protein
LELVYWAWRYRILRGKAMPLLRQFDEEWHHAYRFYVRDGVSSLRWIDRSS